MKKRFLSIFLVFVMVFTLTPAMSFAAAAAEPVKYIDRTWNEQDKMVDETEKKCEDCIPVDDNTTVLEDGSVML